MAPRAQLLNRRLFLGALPAASLAAPAEPFLTPARFGAKGDGRTLDTKALQAAIDACARSGGGTVLLPAGRYLTGTLFLRSRVTLHLTAGKPVSGAFRLIGKVKDEPKLTRVARFTITDFEETTADLWLTVTSAAKK